VNNAIGNRRVDERCVLSAQPLQLGASPDGTIGRLKGGRLAFCGNRNFCHGVSPNLGFSEGFTVGLKGRTGKLNVEPVSANLNNSFAPSRLSN